MSLAIDDLKSFLDHSPTAWHAAKEMGMRLAMHDFIPLNEEERWDLKKGKKYFVIRDGAFVAFQLPRASLQKTLILASHTDSPALKIKPCPLTQKENMTFISSEVYGAPLLSSWLNRDLCIAGKVALESHEGKIEEHLVHLSDLHLSIPQLAIHLDREVNEKGLLLNKQEHLKALIGIDLEKDFSLEKLLRKVQPCRRLLSHDLYLVPSQSAQWLGTDRSLISSYRIDNLASAHASITAMAIANATSDDVMPIVFSANHEEIGSRTEQGAHGTFLSDVLGRIYTYYDIDEEDRMRVLRKSLCVSLDMAHGYHPCYEARFEPNHRPLLGKGVVIKYNAESKYATSGFGAAQIKSYCQSTNIGHQEFVARSDMGCGSTIGPIIAQKLGVGTVDIGIPQLSMHSAREIMAASDFEDLCKLLTHMIKNG